VRKSKLLILEEKKKEGSFWPLGGGEIEGTKEGGEKEPDITFF